MRKLILTMTVTADGFICGPNNETDWLMRLRSASVIDWLEKTLWEGGLHIMGRKTFEVMAPHWAAAQDKIAEPMNKIPKAVFSTTGFVPMESYGDPARELSPYASTWAEAKVYTDLVAGITELKQQGGEPILAHGGAGFAQELVKHGLVDEYRLRIAPVAIGRGKGLFALAPDNIDLQLESSTPFDSGTIVNVYSKKSTE